jgi:hypothetical protein
MNEFLKARSLLSPEPLAASDALPSMKSNHIFPDSSDDIRGSKSYDGINFSVHNFCDSEFDRQLANICDGGTFPALADGAAGDLMLQDADDKRSHFDPKKIRGGV